MSNGLAWFPFYIDDYLGGTSALLPAEHGAYLLALLAQWKSGELKAIPDHPGRLASICRGPDFTPAVRKKFKQIQIDGEPYLQNTRLAEVWNEQISVHESRKLGGRIRAQQIAEQQAGLSAELSAEHSASRARAEKIPDPRSQREEDPIPQNPVDGPMTTKTRAPASREKKRVGPPPKCDDEYLADLQTRDAYAKLNVRFVYTKMLTWCEQKGKQPTRGRLLSWLNHEDQPMTEGGLGNGKGNQNGRETASDRNARLRVESFELLSEPGEPSVYIRNPK